MIQNVGMPVEANQSNPARALDKVCKEFETMFVHQLLKTMTESVQEGFLEEGPAEDIYKDMFNQELAKSIGQSGTLGIADILKKHVQLHFGEDGKTRHGNVHRENDNDR
jgi:Rod binding domain-containing protein